jgi:hypothetical protein
MRAIAIALALFMTSANAQPKSQPPTPYVEWGACPFEGCAYGRWVAQRRTPVLSERRVGAPLAFNVVAGQCVTAITGVVVTSRPGRIKVVSPITLGEAPTTVSLKPGNIIYTLRYLGEGYELFWFNGRIYKDQIYSRQLGPIPTNLPVDPLEVLELPTSKWWIKIRSRTGQVGWSARAEDFGGNDSCA